MGGGSASKYVMKETEIVSQDTTWLLSRNAHENVHLDLEHLNIRDAVGKGKFGLVFHAECSECGKYIAIKFIPKKIILESKAVSRIQQEINILRLIDHPFIIHFFGGFMTTGCVGLAFEYAPGGELYTRMKKQVKFPENVARFYFCEMACALGYLHAANIVYRDLKPENVLLDNSGHIKLCDFGFACTMSSRDSVLNDGCGTAMYVAPEIASGHMKKAHGLPVDWWGMGCILYEMISGDAPFGDTDKMSKFEVFNNIIGKNVTYPMSMSSDVKSILKGLLSKNPQERLAYRDIKQSSWVADVNWEALYNRKINPPWVPPNGNSAPHCDNFVSWPGVVLPQSATSQEISYSSCIELPNHIRWAGSMATNNRVDNEKNMRRKSSARMTNVEVKSDDGNSIPQRKKSQADIGRRQSSMRAIQTGSGHTVESAHVLDDDNIPQRKKSQADIGRRHSSRRDIKIY